MFVKIDEKAAVLIAAAGLLVVWALLAPESLQATIGTVVTGARGAIDGAVSGVQA